MIFRRKLVELERRATHSDVRSVLLLAAMRAFREADGQPTASGATSREHMLIAEFAEPVVVPQPLCNRGS